MLIGLSTYEIWIKSIHTIFVTVFAYGGNGHWDSMKEQSIKNTDFFCNVLFYS